MPADVRGPAVSDAFTVLAAGGTVVTANKRLARSITLDWNHHQRAAGLQAWPAGRVLSWPSFIASLHALSQRRGGEAGKHLLLAGTHEQLLWQRIIDSGSSNLLPGSAAPLAEAAARAWRLLQEWRIPRAALLAAADSQDSLAFATWAGAYQARCDAEGWAEPAGMASLLITDLHARVIAAPSRLHLAGFTERSPLQAELLQALAAQGCMLSEDALPGAVTAELGQRRCTDPADELAEAARWARQWRSHDPGARVAIIVPELAARSAEVRRAILDITSPAWRLQPGVPLPVNFSFGRPLASIGLVRVALRILDGLAGRLDYRHAAELLSSRYLPGHETESAARAGIAWTLGQRIGTAVLLQEVLVKAKAAAPELASRLDGLLKLCGQLPGKQSPGGWAASFRLALEGMGWPGERALESDEFQAVDAWQELLDELRSCDAVSGPIGRAEALRLIRRMAGERLFQPEGDPDAIQVLGLMEGIGQRFDALWVCGMSARSWPPPARDTALLPLRLQREHGMPGSSPALVREQAEKLLDCLKSAAGQVVFSWPAFDGDEPLAPSPLIAALPMAAPELPRWEGACWIELQQEGTRLERLDEDPPPPVGRHEHLRGGARLLELEAICPARAFVECRLGGKELPVPAPGIDALRRGNISHTALQYFFAGIGSREGLLALDAEEQGKRLDAAIDRAMAKHIPQDSDALLQRLVAIEYERQRGLLAGFLALERQRPPFRVLAIEEGLASVTGLPALESLAIRLRPDRIDELEDGSRLVIDYKTGRRLPAKSAWEGRLYSPQLPLYATLVDAAGIAFVQLAAGRLGWQGVAADEQGIEGVLTLGKAKGVDIREWLELRAWWRSQLEELAAELLGGCFNVNSKQPREARGEWAMAIRPHELGEPAEEES